MTLASRDQLFSANGPKRRYIEVKRPSDGMELRIQSLTERELCAFNAAAVDAKNKPRRDRIMDAPRRLIVLCVVDGQGNRMLTDGDVARLADWDAADTQAIAAACMKHNGITGDDEERQAQLEELLGNSSGTTDSPPPTASQQ